MTDPDISADPENRRPLKTRSAAWAGVMAQQWAKAGIKPDTISAASICVAILGAAVLCASGMTTGPARVVLLLIAIACIQGRLLFNMLDGMVAVEHGRGSALGPIWNELPDRFADIVLLAGAGYGAYAAGHGLGPTLGWICAVLAVLTAYVRELGRGLGQPADFSGPMAKPHRMFALSVACLVSMFEPLWGWRGHAFVIALAVIALGCLATVWRRTAHLGRRLKDGAET
jgi:phosphatidylglycerophosphate synthase